MCPLAALRGGLGQGELLSHSLPKTRKAFLVLPFISGAVDGVQPPHFRKGKQELSGGPSFQDSAEGKGAPSIQRVPSSGLCMQ